MPTIRSSMPCAVRVAGLFVCVAASAGLLADEQRKPNLPPPAKHQVDFHKEILPILARRCAKCHTGEDSESELRIDTRQLLLAGGESGKAVVVGDSGKSLLVQLVSGMDPERMMPATGKQLSAEEIGVLRAWIDQGLAWEKDVTLAPVSQRAPLAPRTPKLPPVAADSGLTNPIDRLLQPYFEAAGVKPAEVASDRVFARRAYLDLVGLLPPPERIEALEKDPRPDKREHFVRELLVDRKAYAEHWLTFWNDALRNAYRGTGFIDGGRRQITGWLYKSLYDNRPYDQFVRELIDPVPGSEGFTFGIKWRGVVNASQRREMQAAQSIAQIFMGTNLKCASCHDSFVDEWKLTDSYALANVFADEPVEIHRCNKPTGEFVQPAFLYASLGKIDPNATKPQQLEQLAKIMTLPANGRLARTIVNRLWTRFFGRGLIQSLDDMDEEPLDADLLDWLAADLQDHGYDLKRTMRLICTSRAYQLPSVGAPKPEDEGFVFRGPLVRRMTAEQFVDATSEVTGVWQEVTADMLKPAGQGPLGQLRAVLDAIGEESKTDHQLDFKWIWSDPEAAKQANVGRIFLRKDFELPKKPRHAAALVSCDDEFVLYVNGHRVAAGKTWGSPTMVRLEPWLVQGTNTIAVEATNDPATEISDEANPPVGSPAGFAFYAFGKQADGLSWRLVSDANWRWSGESQEGWQQPGYETSDWQPVAELALASGGPWNLADKFRSLLRIESNAGGKVRAVLAVADPLMRALGRPNREQVVTNRDSVATTLEALELTNGSTLAGMIQRGAQSWTSRHGDAPQDLIEQVYRTALGRKPSAKEMTVARELVGVPATATGVEDLLWIVMMLPEFQLIL